MTDWVMLYLIVLLLVWAIETPIIALFFYRERLRMALICLVTTTLTHVFMHFVLPLLFDTRDAWLIAGELTAFLFEWFAYAAFTRKHSRWIALPASLTANVASYLGGVLVF